MGRATAALAALALVVGACTGDDGGGDEDADEAPEAGGETVAVGPRVPDDLGEGCGDHAVTDTSDLAADRVVARCAPGSPEPAPLPAPATVRVAVPVALGEEQAPLLVAEALGEFEAENLTIERVALGNREAMAALEAGEVDIVVGRLDGPYFDALHQGSRSRLVLGGTLARSANDLGTDQNGLWVADDALDDDGDLSDLELQPVGVPGGIRSAASYPLDLVIGPEDLTLNQVAVADTAAGDAAARLLEGELAAAWLEGGTWHPVAGDDRFHLAATLPVGESIDGTVMSERLTGPDRPVGLAYARAVIRTINTHLTGDYREDDEVTGALAEALEVDAGVLGELPPLFFDWEVREGTLGRIESVLIALGGVTYDVPVDRPLLADRTVAIEAVESASPA